MNLTAISAASSSWLPAIPASSWVVFGLMLAVPELAVFVTPLVLMSRQLSRGRGDEGHGLGWLVCLLVRRTACVSLLVLTVCQLAGWAMFVDVLPGALPDTGWPAAAAITAKASVLAGLPLAAALLLTYLVSLWRTRAAHPPMTQALRTGGLGR